MADNPLAAWLQEQEHGRDEAPGQSGDPLGGPTGAAGAWPLDDPAPRPRSRKRLLLLATLPWLVLLPVALLALGDSGSDTGREGIAAGARSASASPDPGAAGATAPAAVVPPPLIESTTTTPPAGDATLAAAAALEVRAALSGQPGSTRYADGAVTTAINRHQGLVIATVLALVVDGSGEGWTAHTGRYAVALRDETTGPEVVGRPWALPSAGDGQPAPPVPEPELVPAARSALERAGYGELTALVAGRTPDLPGVVLAQVSAVGPGDQGPADHVVWLDDTNPDLAVLGADP